LLVHTVKKRTVGLVYIEYIARYITQM